MRRNPVVQNMEDDDDLSLTFSSSLLYVFWCIIKFFVDFSYSESFFDAFYNSSVASGLEMKWLCAYNLNCHYFTLVLFTVVVIGPCQKAQLRIWDHYVSYELGSVSVKPNKTVFLAINPSATQLIIQY